MNKRLELIMEIANKLYAIDEYYLNMIKESVDRLSEVSIGTRTHDAVTLAIMQDAKEKDIKRKQKVDTFNKMQAAGSTNILFNKLGGMDALELAKHDENVMQEYKERKINNGCSDYDLMVKIKNEMVLDEMRSKVKEFDDKEAQQK